MTANHRPGLQGYIVVLEADPVIVTLERRVPVVAAFYQRRLVPTLALSASMLGAIVVIAFIAHWIAA